HRPPVRPSARPSVRASVRQRLEPSLRTSDVSDADLARQAAAGDGDAFGVLVERYGLGARRVARAVLGPGDDADDAVQDGFIAAWRAIERFDPERSFRPWLMRIVSNAALDLLRRRKVRRATAVPDTVESPGVSPDRAAEGALLRERLTSALVELPERQRIAVVLFDAEGYSHGDIAEILGVPVGTVRSYVFHARRALRRALGVFQEEEG
ncbi:MAG TPA: sigma-70 family RNA polymerase sigma factor, partial [Gemmatimonadales bacterium]